MGEDFFSICFLFINIAAVSYVTGNITHVLAYDAAQTGRYVSIYKNTIFLN